MKRVFLMISILFVLIFSCYSEPLKEVIAYGMGTIFKNDFAHAYDMAIADAKRNAIEKSVGTLVHAETVVRNYQLVSDKIVSESLGYVKKYEVLSKKRDKNLLLLKIKAIVDQGKMSEKVNNLKKMLKANNLSIFFENKIDFKTGDSILTFLKSYFKQEGFEITEAKNSARLLLVLSGNVEKSGYKIGNMSSYQAVLSLKLYDNHTEEFLLGVDGNGAFMHISEMKGKSGALKKALNKMLPNVKNKLVEWMKNFCGINGVKIKLVLLNSDYKTAEMFKKVLSTEVRGVSNINFVGFESGKSELYFYSYFPAPMILKEILYKMPDFSTTVRVNKLYENFVSLLFEK